MPTLSKIEEYKQELGALELERSSWVDHWRDLGRYFAPRKFRYLQTDRDRGTKRNEFIVDGSPLISVRTLASGMQAGLTSPARPWFQLELTDPELNKRKGVKTWLEQVTNAARDSFTKSNIYTALHSLYYCLAIFGTGVFFLEDDIRDPLRAYVFPVGQFFLANDDRLRVATCYRKFSMTVQQLVMRFGEDRCTKETRDAYRDNKLHQWRDVVHLMRPNPDHNPYKAITAKNMAWKSIWYEQAADPIKDEPLNESGFHEQPFMAPRWMTDGEDVYGSSPGMDALGDAKELQDVVKDGSKARKLIVAPPMRGPAALKHARASLVPGSITYVDVIQGGQTYEPAIVINPVTMEITGAQAKELKQRIDEHYFASLWLSLTQAEGDMTAREVAERHEEKMQQLGPVVDRLNDELYTPMMSRAVATLARQGKLPPPPPELQGVKSVEYNVVYTSIMAQAQKLLGTSSKERLNAFTVQAMQVSPGVGDKVDYDALVEAYADDLGVSPSLIRDDKAVANIRATRQKQQAQAVQAEQATQLAKGAKDLSQADTTGDNGLTTLLGNLGGGVTPSPVGTP